MPMIRPISDLRNESSAISEYCHESREPVFITKKGVGDMVVMSVETYERQQARLDLYERLAQADAEIENGDEGVNFNEFAKKLRLEVTGNA